MIEEQFDTAALQDDWSPRYNIAPTQPVPVIRQHPKEPILQISTMRWGLVPYWAKDPSNTTSMINAKFGDSRHEASFPRSSEIPQVFDPSRWLLRVAKKGKFQTTVLF